eukprot:76940-Prymnesium_polylepis.2
MRGRCGKAADVQGTTWPFLRPPPRQLCWPRRRPTRTWGSESEGWWRAATAAVPPRLAGRSADRAGR